MSQDLKTSPGFLDDLLDSLKLLVVEVASLDVGVEALLKTDEDTGSGQQTWWLVREEIVLKGQADDGVGASSQVRLVHGLRKEQPGYHMIKIVKSRR